MPSISKRNIEELRQLLLYWYNVSGRKFRWRENGLSHYELVIAEVLLQRTKAETVSKFYSTFLLKYPDWNSLVIADMVDIELELKPIGLYRQRASRLKKLANEMFERKGVFPQDRNELENIPFLGQYIANAVELMIFGKPSPLIDVNMARVLERYFGERKLADIRYDVYLQDLAKELVNSPNSKEINWAVLDFAALVCRARNPLCRECILNEKCNFFNKKKNDTFVS